MIPFDNYLVLEIKIINIVLYEFIYYFIYFLRVFLKFK